MATRFDQYALARDKCEAGGYAHPYQATGTPLGGAREGRVPAVGAIGVADMSLLCWERAYEVRDPDLIAAARDLTVRFLERAQHTLGTPLADQAVQDAEPVVSELVTTAGKYAPGPCESRLELAPWGIDATPRDSDPGVPRPASHGPGRVGRHGSDIAAALSQRMFTQRHGGGKSVHARMAFR